MRELKNGMPQLDPCCYPLLHPRGTPGYRWFNKKYGREEIEMQKLLDEARANEFEEVLPLVDSEEMEQDVEVSDVLDLEEIEQEIIHDVLNQTERENHVEDDDHFELNV